MVINVALYHSQDTNSEEYWSVPLTAIEYNLAIYDTGRKDWGGESIFTVAGDKKDLIRFIKKFCNAESFSELAPAVA